MRFALGYWIAEAAPELVCCLAGPSCRVSSARVDPACNDISFLPRPNHSLRGAEIFSVATWRARDVWFPEREQIRLVPARAFPITLGTTRTAGTSPHSMALFGPRINMQCHGGKTLLSRSVANYRIGAVLIFTEPQKISPSGVIPDPKLIHTWS